MQKFDLRLYFVGDFESRQMHTLYAMQTGAHVEVRSIVDVRLSQMQLQCHQHNNTLSCCRWIILLQVPLLVYITRSTAIRQQFTAMKM